MTESQRQKVRSLSKWQNYGWRIEYRSYNNRSELPFLQQAYGWIKKFIE